MEVLVSSFVGAMLAVVFYFGIFRLFGKRKP